MDEKKKKVILIVGVIIVVLVVGVLLLLSKDKAADTYVVTFNSNGSSYQIDAQQVKNGKFVVKPEDPVREGYTFVEWQVDGKKFDFENYEITEDLEIVAVWEKNEENTNIDDTNQVNDGSLENQEQDSQGNVSENEEDTENNNNDKELKATLSTPKISVAKAGSIDKNYTETTFLEVSNPNKYKVEIYYSTKEKSGFKLLRTASKADDEQSNWYKVSIPQGLKYYYKIRFINGEEFSDYSNVVSVDNSFGTPKIEEVAAGSIKTNGSIKTFIKLNKLEGKLEIYYSNSKNGTYKLLRTASEADDEKSNWYEVVVPLGEHRYYKVRYVSAGGVRSNYSNVIDYDNSFDTPKLTEVPAGSIKSDGTNETFISLNEFQGNVEVYYATSANGSYKLLKTIKEADGGTEGWIKVSVPKGYHYYFKVRYVNGSAYSSYSNVIDYDNSFGTPKLTEVPAGSIKSDGTNETFISLNEFQGNVEVYYATSANGSYKLLKTIKQADGGTEGWIKVSVPIGYHYYFKVRYVNGSASSSYSNVIDYDNPFSTPVIEAVPAGATESDGSITTFISLNNFVANVEVYYATSANGSYKLLKTIKEADGGTEGWIKVNVPKDTTYYYKVRYANNGVYSSYSNIVSQTN